jgi:UDP-N-acetylglucosamine:LPS N-acetylglucosamine transferase
VAAERIDDERPKRVVSNHPFMVTALTMSREQFRLEVPVIHFQTTTLEVISPRAEPKAKRYLVASPVVRDELARMGVDPEKIDVVGYPVKHAFLRDMSKAKAPETLGLSDTFTWLLMSGGEGVGGQIATTTALRGSRPTRHNQLVPRNSGLILSPMG